MWLFLIVLLSFSLRLSAFATLWSHLNTMDACVQHENWIVRRINHIIWPRSTLITETQPWNIVFGRSEVEKPLKFRDSSIFDFHCLETIAFGASFYHFECSFEKLHFNKLIRCFYFVIHFFCEFWCLTNSRLTCEFDSKPWCGPNQSRTSHFKCICNVYDFPPH